MSSTEKTGASAVPQTAAVAQPTVLGALPESAASATATKTPVKRVVKKPAADRDLLAKPGIRAQTKTVVESATQETPKTATRRVASAAPKAAVKAKALAAPAIKPKSEKLLKAKKLKLVRDSFTIPKLEYLILEELKQRGGKLGSSVKKSELIRAGVKALAAMSDANFLAALKAVPTIKTGRPSNN